MRWRQEVRLEFKKQEEDIEEKKKKTFEKSAQIKNTAVEAKQAAASCILWLDSYAAWQTRFCIQKIIMKV